MISLWVPAIVGWIYKCVGGWYIPDYFPPVGWRVYLWGAEGLGFLHLAAALVSPLSEVSLFGVSFSMAFLTCFLVVLGLTQRM